MKTTILYKSNGEKIEVRGGIKYEPPSYDSMIDLPLPQRVLETYRQLEASGKLGPNDCEVSKTYTKRLWENAAKG